MIDVLKTWKPKFELLARAVCILVPEWSVQWYDLIQETDFGSLESHISKTIRPTWATSRSYCFLVSLRGCCVALSSVTRSFQVVLVLSNAQGAPAPWYSRFSGIKAGDFEHLKPRTLWLCNPTIRIALHATETRNQGFLNANCRWLCMALDMDDLFLRSRFYRWLGFVSHLREFRVDTGLRRREL